MSEIIAIFIPMRAEDAVKLRCKVSVKMEEKIKQKRGWCGMGDAMKMACDVGRVNDEKKSCEGVKNFQGCCSV